MELVDVLTDAEDNILDQACRALGRSHLKHYEASGADEVYHRLKDLYRLTVDCLVRRELVPIANYADTVARARFTAGFDIGEVQTAFNVLEEAIWQQVVTTVPAEDLAESIGLISTVLGVGKDTLARTWVALATGQHVSSFDLERLFRGTSS